MGKDSLLLNILKYSVSFVFAFAIIYVLFQHQNPVKLFEEIQKVEMGWVFLSIIFGALAYVSRGLRWIVLIDALGYKSSKINSIASVSVGYFTNLFIPRAGEISRCTALNQAEKIPGDKLFGTILIERVIDLIFLFALIILAFFLKLDDLLKFFSTLQTHQTDSNAENSKILILLSITTIGIAGFFLLKKWMKNSVFYQKILGFFDGLKEGFKSIKKMKRKSVFWIHTFSIWIMYFLMTYICFFSMSETSGLTVGDALFLLVLGGIGMVIPTPGGIGSYHAIVMIGLAVLGVGFINLTPPEGEINPALVFPTVVHVAQTVVAII
ncbi:MAG: lysylphosphatidylglycerol synthase transmembrane domain-containing protein, partial [Bacteroidota bacterium]|nr:lysylphosphatidylglycerol synthase transmembrane domain-containing protein [Bacteroidota bacterium]